MNSGRVRAKIMALMTLTANYAAEAIGDCHGRHWVFSIVKGEVLQRSAVLTTSLGSNSQARQAKGGMG